MWHKSLNKNDRCSSKQNWVRQKTSKETNGTKF